MFRATCKRYPAVTTATGHHVQLTPPCQETFVDYATFVEHLRLMHPDYKPPKLPKPPWIKPWKMPRSSTRTPKPIDVGSYVEWTSRKPTAGGYERLTGQVWSLADVRQHYWVADGREFHLVHESSLRPLTGQQAAA